MSFLIPNAWAAASPPAGGASSLLGFLPIVVFFAFAYFLLMRPQQKRLKDHRALLATLARGDEVVTNGGLLGRITEVQDSFVGLEVAPGIVVRVQKPAVQSVLPKGSLKF